MNQKRLFLKKCLYNSSLFSPLLFLLYPFICWIYEADYQE